MRADFIIAGPPVAKGRPRFRRAGNYVQTYTPKETAEYEARVKEEYRKQCGDLQFGKGVPLKMEVQAYFPIPKSTSAKKATEMNSGKILPAGGKDLDNVLKIICDGCNKTAYYDDSQIVSISGEKHYSTEPRVCVSIQEVRTE